MQEEAAVVDQGKPKVREQIPLPRYKTARRLAPEAVPEALSEADRLKLGGGMDIYLVFGCSIIIP